MEAGRTVYKYTAPPYAPENTLRLHPATSGSLLFVPSDPASKSFPQRADEAFQRACLPPVDKACEKREARQGCCERQAAASSNMSTSLTAIRAHSAARLQAEQRTQERRRACLVLAMRFLQDQGYVESLAKLQQESNVWLTKVDLADNVELPLVLQEFEEYYESKFGKRPKLLRMVAGGTDVGRGAAMAAVKPGLVVGKVKYAMIDAATLCCLRNCGSHVPVVSLLGVVAPREYEKKEVAVAANHQCRARTWRVKRAQWRHPQTTGLSQSMLCK